MLIGEFDLDCVEYLYDELRGAGQGSQEVIVDLRATTFLDVAAAEVFMWAETDGLALRFRRACPSVARVLQLTGLGQTAS